MRLLAHRPRACAIAIGCVSALTARAEPFIGQFELKTLDAEAGAYEFQSQNAWAWDQPARRVASSKGAPASHYPRVTNRDPLSEVDDGETSFDENALFRERYALELEIGLSERYKLRVGIEAERERLDDPATIEDANRFGSLEADEIGAELVTIFVPREADGFGLGAVMEIEGPIDQEEPNHLSIGPIVEFQAGEWFAAAVPMLVYAFGGDTEEDEPVDSKWDFAYAAQLMRRLSPSWSAAIEAYGTIERLGNSGQPSESARKFGDFDQHRAGLVVYYMHDLGGSRRTSISPASAAEEALELTIGFGLLQGLNRNTADHTLKLSVEVDF